jgi:hypothetical protein
MNGKPAYFLRLVPLILAIPLVWPPTVLVQEKKPSPAVQLPGEKKDPLDAFFAERDRKEALAKAACQNLPDASKISERSWQNRMTEQDRELIQDRERWVHAVKELIVCSEKLSGDERAEALVVVGNLMKERMEYQESRERGLVAKYNDLVASYNELVTLAAVAILHPSPTAPSSYPWLKPTAPISGPVVCRGNATAMGQGVTNVYVNCN